MQKNKFALLGLVALSIIIAGFLITKKFAPNNPAPTVTENAFPEENPAPPKGAPHPDSLPVLMAKDFQGHALQLEKVLDKNEAYTRYYITYRSEGLKISGILNVPVGAGPFPVLLLNHGFIEPAFYKNGQGLKREQDYFARRGYAVLHSDYRNYAASDSDPDNDTKPRTGYTEDVINAIYAIKNSDLQSLDKERIGMLGHSMGGGITLNVMVVKPELVKAFVLLAPINADYKENFDRWVAPEMSDIAQKTLAKYGTFETNPEFWKTVSAENYFANITSPILLHQGALDQDVPVEWSQELNDNLKKAAKAVTYYEYPNEPHTFINAQAQVMQRSLEFFDTHVKNSQN
ncbi:MAG: alpha/beta fold hydrolase [Parcubacteria group bacterium]|jgi:dipeptidyl aminopeptidase/acylaminoacyl peptidase